jgi:hypothetical protein
MTDEVNDAGLNDGLWKDGGDRLGKALHPHSLDDAIIQGAFSTVQL